MTELQSDHEAFMEQAKNVATMYMNRCENNFVKYEGNDFINTVGFAMHLRPDESKLKEGSPGDAVFFADDVVKSMDHILEAIRNYGGNDPYMIIYPILLEIDDSDQLFNDIVCLPLFRVRSKEDQNTSKYFDTNGRYYSDEDDFKNNIQLPPGEMFYPKDLLFSRDKDGNAEVVHFKLEASKMKYVDRTVNLLCLGAGVLAISTGVGIPFAMWTAIACGSYMVTRSTQTLVDRAQHGQSISPFADWDSFNAWAGIISNFIGFGAIAKSIQLSGQISKFTAEGLAISRSTKLALNASIYIPHFINGGVMAVQFYQLAAFWDRLPVEHKIIVILQFLFFAATSAKMKYFSVEGIEERAASAAYNELRDHLATNSDDPGISDIHVRSMDQAAERVGGRNNFRVIDFFKKLVNYKQGALIHASTHQEMIELVELTKVGDEMGFKVRQKYFCGPEATLELNEDLEQTYGRRIDNEDDHIVPIEHEDSDKKLDSILKSKNFVHIDEVKKAQKWLKEQLDVSHLEEYKVNDVPIFENMKYHDQIRLKIFEDIGEGLKNENLIKNCLKYASEQDVKTVGQYASEYEIASLEIHRLANEKTETFSKLTPEEVETQYKIGITKETRMTYKDLGEQRANTLFADEPNQRFLNSLKRNAINSMESTELGKDAVQVINNWERTIEIPQAKTIASPDADLVTLANEVIDAGDLSFQNSEFQAINAASFFKQYNKQFNIDIADFAQIFAEDANNTIKSCRESVESSRVFEVTREIDVSRGFRRLVFHSLEDGENAKSVVVCINKRTGEVRIQNFTLKNIISKSRRNAREVVYEHWQNNFDYQDFKTTLRTLVNTIKPLCEEYVGPQLVRAGLDHGETVSDIQSLKSVRFASIEHAICHVLKHGENVTTTEQIVREVGDYFNKAQKVIQSTKENPENVSSSWTQTGSARDFFFYRKNPKGKGMEKVVVLVREGGEVIMKTYFVDEKMSVIPSQKKHFYQKPVDIKHEDFRTFYFQLMLMAPRYGVLLPKDYELIESELDKEKTRTLIIMAGHYFNKDGSVNVADLSKAINSAFPLDRIKWSVVAMKVQKAQSSDVGGTNAQNYMFARIKNFFFEIFAIEPSKEKQANLKPGAKEKYGSIPNNAEVKEANGFDSSESLDIACRICSHWTIGTDITKAMNECFGEQWNCFWLTDFYSDIDTSYCYLKVYLANNNALCIVFR